MHEHAVTAAMIAYFVVSWAFAAYMIYDLATDGQKNPSSQYSCLAKFLLGPPLMAAWGWSGMAAAVLISGAVLVAGRFLTRRR